jgi:hypothetical protein
MEGDGAHDDICVLPHRRGVLSAVDDGGHCDLTHDQASPTRPHTALPVRCPRKFRTA